MDLIKEQKKKARSIKEMIATEGWRIIEEELNGKTKNLTRDLLEIEDLNKIYRTQAEIKAIQSLIQTIVNYALIDTDKMK